MLTLLAMAALGAPASEMRLLRYPAVHDHRVVFSYASDLWSWEPDGGTARRLTAHPNNEYRPRISPDGTMIAFTGSYDGNPEVYVMPIDGGEPKRLTFEPQADLVAGWTPDGKIAYISSAGSNTDNHPRLWLVSPNGGLPQPTPILEAADVSFSPDGTKVAYHRMNGNAQNWRQYRGGRQARISIYNLKTNEYSELPNGNENSYSPLWVGDSIYYLSDKDEDAGNLFRYNLANRKAERLTDFKDSVIRTPDTDGKSIVFEHDGLLYSYGISDRKLTVLNPVVNSDNLAARPALKRLANQITDLALSTDGSKLAVIARGELFNVNPKTGEAINLTRSSGARDESPKWSPDGKSIAFVSDRSGEWEIYTVPADGGTLNQVTTGLGTQVYGISWSPDGKLIAVTNRAYELKIVDVGAKTVSKVAEGGTGPIVDTSWAPDSHWLAYIAYVPNGNSALFLYDQRTGAKQQVTGGEYSDLGVSFDPGGRYLYLQSARVVNPGINTPALDVSLNAFQQGVYALSLTDTFGSPIRDDMGDQPAKKPEDFRIDLEGLGSRVVTLPFAPGTYGGMSATKDGVAVFGPSGISHYTLGKPGPDEIFPGQFNSLAINSDGTKIAYFSGNTLGIADVKPGQRMGVGRIDASNIAAVIDPRAEWKQIFWEAWRYERDNFYDPNMRGLNWKAIGDHYASMLPDVAHRSDLTYILGMMIGELRTSHTYVQEGDTWITQPGVPVGLLGADYETDSGKVRFKRVYRGNMSDDSARGPLAEPGSKIKEGDYLLEIDGEAIDDRTNPHLYLVDKVNKWVTLTVNSRPTLGGSRKVRVRPTGNESGLRYYEWVEVNRRYVDKASGGKIGYMHVPDTSAPGAIGVASGYYRNSDKQALIVDERNNHGGYNPTFFVDLLKSRTVDSLMSRYGPDTGSPAQTIDGPKAMLINGYAGSGGDLFPYLFRKAKAGPLIGTRTWGGAVGINGFFSLVDGGTVSAPEFAWYDADTGKWIAENEGLYPDLDVDLRPDLVWQGKDPQLDKAVEYLLGEIAKNPRKVLRPEIKRIGGG